MPHIMLPQVLQTTSYYSMVIQQQVQDLHVW